MQQFLPVLGAGLAAVISYKALTGTYGKPSEPPKDALPPGHFYINKTQLIDWMDRQKELVNPTSVGVKKWTESSYDIYTDEGVATNIDPNTVDDLKRNSTIFKIRYY